jgi:hypothetical protein
MTAGGDDGMDAALADIRRACDAAEALVRTGTDPARAFTGATEMAKELRNRAWRASHERADAARRLMEAEDLSLSQLAVRLGISKQRADQIIKQARKHAR